MFVNDILGYSDFFVAIQDVLGLNHPATVLRDEYQFCTSGPTPYPNIDLGCRSHVYDLYAFNGQHIGLIFYNRNLWPKFSGSGFMSMRCMW